MNVDTPNLVSAEEAYNRASKKLTRSLVIMGVLEMLVIAIGATLFYFSVQEGAVLPAMVGVVAMFLGTFVSAVFLIFLMFGLIKLQELFWKETAEGLGYAYVKNPPITADALMFREGHGRSTGHGLLGHLSDEHPFRFFQYSYVTGSGKSRQTHNFCVFEVSFSGTFPHLYLNNKHNKNLSGMKDMFLPRITLPTEFEKQFSLYVPKGYEIEALELFTPDLLAQILDMKWKHDVELVQQKLYVFSERYITKREQLVEELSRLKTLTEYIAPKLDQSRLYTIGDLKHSL